MALISLSTSLARSLGQPIVSEKQQGRPDYEVLQKALVGCLIRLSRLPSVQQTGRSPLLHSRLPMLGLISFTMSVMAKIRTTEKFELRGKRRNETIVNRAWMCRCFNGVRGQCLRKSQTSCSCCPMTLDRQTSVRKTSELLGTKHQTSIGSSMAA